MNNTYPPPSVAKGTASPPPSTLSGSPPSSAVNGLATSTLIWLIGGIGGVIVVVGVAVFFISGTLIGPIWLIGGYIVLVVVVAILRTKRSNPSAKINYEEHSPKLSVPTTTPGISSNTQLSTRRISTPLVPPLTSTFTYEELAKATDGFSEANLIGQGGFGNVYKGVLSSMKWVAIKQLKARSSQGDHEFKAEVETISRVHHEHLVSPVGYCTSGAQRMLVYEFVPNKTLKFHLHGEGSPTMGWANRMKIALGCAKGLAYLHEDCHPKIIHRDIKADNILLDDNFEAKVTDFGLAKFCSDTDTHISTQVKGTVGYIDPEYASSGKPTDKSDVFSFGVVLLELITGHRHIDKIQSSTKVSLADWARPLLKRACKDGNFDTLVDPRLRKDYNSSELKKMVACAADCVRKSGQRRPQMSQIVRALEGHISLDDLKEGSTESDTSQYKKSLKRFRKIIDNQGRGTGSTSEFSSNPSGSNSLFGVPTK